MEDDDITYRWRGEISDAELVALTESYGGASEAGWWDGIRPFSLGWVTARLSSGAAVGFVNVAWDGGDHAFLIDTKTRPDLQHRGIGTELVRIATRHAKEAGCEWLHVDYTEDLEPFYIDACEFRPTPAGLIHLPDLQSPPAEHPEDCTVRLAGDRVVVRSASAADAPAIVAVMQCPGVRAWWWDFDLDDPVGEISDPGISALVVEHDGRVIGFMQFSEEESLQYHHASIELSLHDDYQGRGLGSDAVRTLARYLLSERGHHRLTIDPALRNERAIRCYERVGFQRVGIMRQYERGADGEWHDGLLMDLLAGDLR